MTTTYLSGNIQTLLKPIGSLGTNLDQNLSNRLTGSHEHEMIARIRIYTTAGIWLLALAGLARRRLAGRSDMALAVIGGAPFILLVLQPYGGEMLLRVFLFSLAPVAFFAASVVFASPVTSARPWVLAGVTVLGCCLLLTVFQFTRYGNERVDSFTQGDVRAVRALYRLAPPGSVLFAGSNNLPWRYRNYADYEYRTVTKLGAWRRDPNATRAVIAAIRASARGRRAYIIVTRSTTIASELLEGTSSATLRRFELRLSQARNAIRQVYQDRDGLIFFVRGTG
jgi:hypothetical protein